MANVKLVSPQAYDIVVTAQIVGPTAGVGLAANSRTVGNIITQAGIPPVQVALVPGNELWHIEDIFNALADPTPVGVGTLGIDVQVEIVVNGTPQPFTPTMSAINVADDSRLRLPRSVMLPAAGSLNVNFVNMAITTSTGNVSVHLKTLRYPTAPGPEG